MIPKIKATLRDYKGMKLCDNCWNGKHYAFKDKNDRGKLINKYCACNGCGCECPCAELMQPERRVKFTGEGQTLISMDGALDIKASS
jgi:hypothetical protein